MGVALVIHVFGVHSHNSAGDPASFRIPTYVISNFEYSCHGGFRAKLHPISRGSALVPPSAQSAISIARPPGLGLQTPFGTIHSPNITPDPDTGVGRWSLELVTHAKRRLGVSPQRT